MQDLEKFAMRRVIAVRQRVQTVVWLEVLENDEAHSEELIIDSVDRSLPMPDNQ